MTEKKGFEPRVSYFVDDDGWITLSNTVQFSDFLYNWAQGAGSKDTRLGQWLRLHNMPFNQLAGKPFQIIDGRLTFANGEDKPRSKLDEANRILKALADKEAEGRRKFVDSLSNKTEGKYVVSLVLRDEFNCDEFVVEKTFDDESEAIVFHLIDFAATWVFGKYVAANYQRDCPKWHRKDFYTMLNDFREVLEDMVGKMLAERHLPADGCSAMSDLHGPLDNGLSVKIVIDWNTTEH